MAWPQIEIGDPLNNPAQTSVLDYDGEFLVDALGDVRHGGIRYLTRVWGKVYVNALPGNSPYLNDPYQPDPTALEGYVEPTSRDFFFLGSATTPDPAHNSKLLALPADPGVTATQHLYVWGLMSDGKYAEPDHVTMNLVVNHETNAGDTVP